MFWPGVDKWPPPKWVWIAAAIMTFVLAPLLFLIGTVGIAIYGAVVVVCLILGANARLKNIGAEDLWRSRPKD